MSLFVCKQYAISILKSENVSYTLCLCHIAPNKNICEIVLRVYGVCQLISSMQYSMIEEWGWDWCEASSVVLYQ